MSDDEYGGKAKAPRKKRKSKGGNEDDDEFVGAEPKKARGVAALSLEEKERLIGEVSRYLVLAEGDKTKITRTEISKAVLAEKNLGSALTGLLPLAEAEVKRLFGWEMKVIPSFTEKGKLKDAGKVQNMMMRVMPELESFMAPIREELPPQPNQIFLMIVLSIILMHNFAADEDILYTSLKAYGIQKSEPNNAFGGKTAIELIKELTKAHYLETPKVPDSVVDLHFVNIGPRSLLEIGKVNILKFINSICNTPVDPSALREFTIDQESYLPTPATAEQNAEQQTASVVKNRGAPAVDEAEDAVPNGANGHATANGTNGAAMSPPARGAGGRRNAKASAAAPNGSPQASSSMDVEDTPVSPPSRRGRRK